MAILPKATQEQFDAMSDEMKGHYVQKDGVYTLEVTPVDGIKLENVDNLLSTVSKQKGDINGLNSQLKAFRLEDGSLMDANQAREAIKKVSEYGQLTPEQLAEQKMADYKASIATAHQGELDAANKKATNYFEQLKSVMLLQQAESEIAKAGGNVELLRPHVLNQLIMAENEAGKLTVGVNDGSGNFAIKDGQGNLKTIGDVVEGLKNNDAFKSSFNADLKGGTGAKPGQDTPGSTPIDTSELKDWELLDHARQRSS